MDQRLGLWSGVRSGRQFSFEAGDFVFDSEFLAFKFRDTEFVGVWSLVLVFDGLFQCGVPGAQSFDMLGNRHR